MLGERFAQWLRFGAVALFSIVLASCGSGDGEDSVDAPQDEVAAAELRLVFADYFGDAPATNSKTIAKAPVPPGNWIVDTGYGPDGDGWGNDEWQEYTNSIDNVFTENGNLVLRAKCLNPPACGKRDGTITSGKVLSKDRINVNFGNVRARIKMPDGGGMWPAFWMLGSDIDERPWPDAGEIDIVELFYYFSDNRTTHFTMHWAGPPREDGLVDGCSNPENTTINPDEVQRCYTVSKQFKAKDGFPPLTDDFHVYELDWTEDRIVGKIDGYQYFARAIDGATMEEFLKEYFMILNVAVGGTLGGQQGPWMTADEWNDPNKTDMLVDWVEVWERVPATSATLIDESGKNIRYNGILNTVNSGGGLVEVDLKDTDVPALVGSQTMSVAFSNTFTGVPGSRPVTFSGAIFDFSGKNFADFDSFVFSLDSSRFAGFKDLGVQLEDRDGNKVLIRTADRYLTATSGTWRTYSIPLADFPGVDMNNITGIGFFNPYDTSGNLAAGTVYFDDIRFTRSTAQCTAGPSIDFDSIAYNPAAELGEISVSDPCAANSFTRVTIENDTDSIVVGVKLDSAGNGSSLFGIVVDDSICATNDAAGYLQLSGQLLATYNRAASDRAGASSAFAAAGIDANAPVKQFTGKQSYFYATDLVANPLTYFPDDPSQPLNFNYSFFGSGSDVGSQGDFADPDFSPVWRVQSGTGYGAEVAQLVLVNITAGYPVGQEFLVFKTKDVPRNIIRVELAAYGGSEFVQGRDIDLVNSEFSTPVPGTTGWYQVRVPIQGSGWFVVVNGQLGTPISSFSRLSDYNGIGFVGSGSPSQFSVLLTDIALERGIPVLPPAQCSTPGGGGGDPATGGTVPEVVVIAADGSTPDLEPGNGFTEFTQFGSGASANTAFADDNSYANATEVTIGVGYGGGSMAQFAAVGFPEGFAESYDEFLFKVKGLTADNTILAKIEPAGSTTVSVDLSGTSGSGYTVENLGDGWSQVVIQVSAFGDVSVSSQFLFQTLDGAYPEGAKFYLTDIGFNNGAGGGGGELITNGTFETGNTSGWELVANDGTFDATMDQAASGSWSGNLVASVPAGGGPASFPLATQRGLAQGDVTPGQNINVSFDICGAIEGIGGVFQSAILSEIDSGGASATNPLFGNIPLSETWTNYQMSLAAGSDVSGGITLQLKADCGGNPGCTVNAYVDNVSVTLGMDTGNPSNAGGACPIDTGGGGGDTDPVVFDDDFGNGVTFFEFGGSINDLSVDTTEMNSGTASLKVVVPDTSYTGGAFTVDPGRDVSGYDQLTFWAKASDARTLNVVGVGNDGVDTSNQTEVANIALTTTWTQYTIAIPNQGALTANKGLFHFAEGSDEGPYTIWFDDIQYTRSGGDPVVFDDDYGDGVTFFEFGGSINDLSVDTTEMNSGTASLKVVVPDTSYTGGAFTVDPGRDVSGYDQLTFWAKASDARTLNVVGVGNDGVDTSNQTEVANIALTTTWTQYTIAIPNQGALTANKGLFHFAEGSDEGPYTIWFDDITYANTGGGGGPGPGPGEELAINGNFDDDFTGWAQIPSAQTTQTIVVDPTTSSKVARLLIPAAAGGVNNVLKQERLEQGNGVFNAGDTVTISFDYRGEAGQGIMFVKSVCETSGAGICGDKLHSGGPFFGTANWTAYTDTFVLGASADAYTLEFAAVCGATGTCVADFYIDNVSITIE